MMPEYEPKEGDRVAHPGFRTSALPDTAYTGTVDGFGEIEGEPIVYVVWDDGEMLGHRASDLEPLQEEGKE